MALFMRFPTKSLPHIERRPNASAAFPWLSSPKLIRGCNRLIWRSVVTFEAAVARTLRRYGSIAYFFSGGRIS